MNWYRFAKFAAIWDVQSDESFEDELRKLYELEFKYNMLRSYPFNGMEKRRSNILIRLEKEAWETISYLTTVLDDVFSQWLAGHAITNPQQWAEARMVDSEYNTPDELLNNFFYEFRNLNNSPDCYLIIQYLNSNPEAFEPFMEAVRMDDKEMQYNDIQGEYFETEEEREAELEQRTSYTDQMTIGDWIENYHSSSQEGIISGLEQISNFMPINNILVGLYRDVLFDMWMARWGPEGIEETRETIETIYSNLKSIHNQDIAKALSTINIAINASHQTGKMTDYLNAHPDVSYGVEDLLDGLSSMDEESQQWMAELKSIGLQVAA